MASETGREGNLSSIFPSLAESGSLAGANPVVGDSAKSSAFGDGVLQLDHLVDDQVQPSRGITFIVCEACGGNMPARPCPADSPDNGATSHDVCDACKPGYEARIREMEDLADEHAAQQEREGNELAERLEREAEERFTGEEDEEAGVPL